MDLDSLDAPMFVDFDMIKRGEEEGEGDEWFGKCIIISLCIINQLNKGSYKLGGTGVGVVHSLF